MIFNKKTVKLEAICWTSLASHDSTHFLMVQFILEIGHDFAMKTLETYSFSTPICDTPSSVILVENSLEGKHYHSKMSIQRKSPTEWHF